MNYPWQATVQDDQGNAVVNPVVTVWEADGVTLATIYDVTGAEIANPINGSLEGFVQFWAAEGEYRIEGAYGGEETEVWSWIAGVDLSGIESDISQIDSVIGDLQSSLAIGAATGVPSVEVGANVATIQTNGYYVSGDGGDAMYRRVAGEPAHGGKLQSADGAWWEISGYDLDVRKFGAKCDGVTDDRLAIQASIDYNGVVNLVSGVCAVGGTLVSVNKDLSIIGKGRDKSKLKFTSNNTGISFVNNQIGPSSDTRKNILLSDFTISTTQNSTTATAVFVEALSGGLVGDASVCTFRGLDIRGDDHYAANVNKWHKGFHLRDAGSASFQSVRVYHSNTGGLVSGSCAFHIQAVQGTNLRYFMNDIHTLWHDTALWVNGASSANRAEGFYLSNYEFVGAQNGVLVSGSEAHAVEISNGHMDCEAGCVVIAASAAGSTGIKLMGNYLQLDNKATGVPKANALLNLQGVSEGSVIGNYIFNTTAVNQIGVYCGGASNVIVLGNTFDGSYIGTDFAGNATYCREYMNNYKANVATKRIAGGANSTMEA